MPGPQQQITLYFDLVSAFSYLCFATLRTHPLFISKNVVVTYIPVSIGRVIIKSGNSPAIVPGRKSAKQDYLVRDFARRARVLGMPVLEGLPKGVPGGVDSKPILQILLVLQQEFGERVYVEAIEKFYQALWRDGVDFTASDISKRLLSSLNLRGNPDVESIIKKAESEEVMELLKKNTQEVLDQGGFGLPWIKAMNAKGETDTWWGADQLTQVAGFLGLDWPEGETEKGPRIRYRL
ncbi:thioredoxin-like protein [Tirmania nivea]|nr:thioredoxin-like protein [Tirmania nivea]